MNTMFRRLMSVLAGSTRSDLRAQVQFLKAENEILRSRLTARFRATPQERARLVKLGKPLGAAIRDIVTIVKPQTFAKWVNRQRPCKKKAAKARRKPGRPRTPEQIRQLILRLARETDWGYTRILGELRKLRITSVTRTTIANILKEDGIEPAPTRAEHGTWAEFLKAHAKTLWACDFVYQKVWTWRGLVDAFVLVFIHVNTRRVVISPSTTKPDAAWVEQQARDFAAATGDGPNPPRMLLRDRDDKFGNDFDAILKRATGTSVNVLPFRSPNLNAFAERFVRTLRGECLDRFVVLGTRHLDHLVREFTDYYNRQRPHSRLDGHRPPVGPAPPPGSGLPPPRVVRCEERLGGVLKHYYRQVA